MIQRLDCSKCGINQADTDKSFVALPVPFICRDCFKQQISLEKQIKKLEQIIANIEDWAIVTFDEKLLKLIGKLKRGKTRK